jgi:hypothetical protein
VQIYEVCIRQRKRYPMSKVNVVLLFYLFRLVDVFTKVTAVTVESERPDHFTD